MTGSANTLIRQQVVIGNCRQLRWIDVQYAMDVDVLIASKIVIVIVMFMKSDLRPGHLSVRYERAILCSMHDALFEIFINVLGFGMVLNGRFGRSLYYLRMVPGIRNNLKEYHTSCLHCKAALYPDAFFFFHQDTCVA